VVQLKFVNTTEMLNLFSFRACSQLV